MNSGNNAHAWGRCACCDHWREQLERQEEVIGELTAWAASHINDPGRTNDEPAVLAARAVRAILNRGTA